MTTKLIPLKNRCVISISGEDQETFLQGLITNDIRKSSDKKAIYALMLNPAGRFLYDFFIIKHSNQFLLECQKDQIDEIIKKFSLYKLRSKVEIKKTDFDVFVNMEELAEENINFIKFTDPRNADLGNRIFLPPLFINNNNFLIENDEEVSQYNYLRLNLKIPDHCDLTIDKSFPVEFGLDKFGAIDYKKGCYVGQETTARMYYKSVLRKHIFLVRILDSKEIEKNSEIIDKNTDKKIGEILSSVFYENDLLALALIKDLDNQNQQINLSGLNLTVFNNNTETKLQFIN